MAGQSGRAEPPQRPNMIVIFCDNLGYGDIEPFGSPVHRTPALRRMAAEGRRFTHFCVTSGVCTPSRASLMTGCYAQRVGMHTNPRDGQVLRPVSPYGLNPTEITIAEVLEDVGYATAIIGKWHLGDQPELLPTRQGFDLFFGIPYSDDMTAETGRRLGERLDGNRWPPLPLMHNDRVIEAPVDRNQLTRRYTECAVEFIREHRGSPFFLYLPHAMPGSTKEPFASDAFRGHSRNGPWGDSVEELDWSTGVLLDELVRLKLDRNTLVVWTSDNGAPLASNPDDLSRGSNRPLHGRGYTTGEGAFRVPTLMWWPGQIPAGTTCDQLCSTMDLLPTFAALTDSTLPKNRIIDGHDIRPLMFDGVSTLRSPYDAFYYYQQDQLQAVRSGRWKLFLPLDSFTRHPHFAPNRPGQTLLFDLVDDPGCETNVAPDHPEIVRRLNGLATQARGDLGDRGRPGKNVRPPGHVSRANPQTLSER
ncbi:sulfatase [Roseiconus nitratireducens]|uniref:Sulfatase n=2 Tax=Roseiconus nitratireducens TaxID=2605748 RepID=A0A5M6DJU6_9BACT|nr:sulfatase [Roseiconus nitratireducens]